MRAPRKILVPVDFSPSSRVALDYAADLAATFEGSLDLLHAWEPPRYVGPEVSVAFPGATGESLADYVRNQAGRELEELAALARRRGLSRVRGRIEVGEPRDVIVRVAGADGYDLVVMCTHGRRGLSRLLIGSVTEGVVRRAPCPVLTLRSPDAALA